MKILSLDPGENTGIVFFNFSEDRIIKSLTLDLTKKSAFLLHTEEVYSMLLDSDIVIMENKPRFPTWSPSVEDFFQKVMWVCREVFSKDLDLIFPGMWKPVAKAMSWNIPDILGTKHEKDAYRMLRYYLMKENPVFRSRHES